MRRRTAAFVGLAVAVLLSALQVLLWRASIVPTVYVAVSKAPLSALTAVNAADVVPKPVPVTAVLPGMVTSFTQIAHLYPLHDIPAGVYLTTGDFESAPLRDGLCPGEVSVTVPVQNAANAEGVYPGMYVEVTQPVAASTSIASSGQGVVVATGLRVISVMTSSGAPISQTAPPSGFSGLATSDTPSMVELAVPMGSAPTFINASAHGELVFSQDPWTGPTQVCAASATGLGTGPGTVVPPQGSSSGAPGVSAPSQPGSRVGGGIGTSGGSGATPRSSPTGKSSRKG